MADFPLMAHFPRQSIGTSLLVTEHLPSFGASAIESSAKSILSELS